MGWVELVLVSRVGYNSPLIWMERLGRFQLCDIWKWVESLTHMGPFVSLYSLLPPPAEDESPRAERWRSSPAPPYGQGRSPPCASTSASPSVYDRFHISLCISPCATMAEGGARPARHSLRPRSTAACARRCSPGHARSRSALHGTAACAHPAPREPRPPALAPSWSSRSGQFGGTAPTCI